jgi:hypothetical protein
VEVNVCAAPWCLLEAAPGGTSCALHRRVPLAHSWETKDEWSARARRLEAAAKKAAAKAAESDAKLKQRGR